MKAYKVYRIVDFVFLPLFHLYKALSLLSQMKKLKMSVLSSHEYAGAMAGETRRVYTFF